MAIRIITDSAADFTREELASYNVHAVALQTIFGEETFYAGETIDRDTYWTRMMAGENAKTSQPSPDAFCKAFEAAKEAGDEVIYIGISTAISGTVQSAMLGKTMAEYDRVHIIDSTTATAAQKILVLTACRLRDEGKTAAEIVDAISKLSKRAYVFAAVDTLEYLVRGGRLSKAAAAIGTIARLKPLVYLESESRVEAFAKAVGRHRAIEAMVKKVESFEIDYDYPVIPIYSYDSENCEAFLKKLDAAGISYNKDMLTDLGATIATHIGPNLYGLCFIAK